MTVLRAWVRRNLTKNPKALPLIRGHELSWLAMTLEKHRTAPWRQRKADEDCSRWDEFCRPWTRNKDTWDWEATAVQNPDGMQIAPYNPDPKSRSHRVMAVRRNLGKLADWTGVASAEAIPPTQATELTMDTLFDHGSKDDDEDDEVMWSLTVRGAPVHFRLSYNNGRWTTDANKLDLVLSLWLYFAHEKGAERKWGRNQIWHHRQTAVGQRNNRKALSPNLGAHTATSCLYQDLKWWVPDGAARVIEVCFPDPQSAEGIETRSVDAHRMVEFATNKIYPFPPIRALSATSEVLLNLGRTKEITTNTAARTERRTRRARPATITAIRRSRRTTSSAAIRAAIRTAMRTAMRTTSRTPTRWY